MSLMTSRWSPGTWVRDAVPLEQRDEDHVGEQALRVACSRAPRGLGDTYQLLSDEARKGARPVCQTPLWVARLLLRLSLEPASAEWGAHRSTWPVYLRSAAATGRGLSSGLWQRCRA